MREECWLCEEHVITLYIWTPRIGLFSMIKDEEEIRYYREKLAEVNVAGPASVKDHRTPHFASPNTSWQYVPMKEIGELCK